ncbi:MAG: hypothetical protein GDA39_10610 [Hyphomonadaceae bacterium]|nr:hypothetical protein [Hyphomonadaceae bacterium]MBC6413271.1 hypothetical protein [Hyphomonadaceae bacterium]
MNELFSYTAPVIARVLNVALIIVMGLLALFAVFLVAFGIFMLFDPDPSMATRVSEGLKRSGYNTVEKVAPFFAAVLALAYFYIASVVRGIVKTLTNGNPFVEGNISRLRKTWIIVALAEIFRIFAINDTTLSSWFLVFVIATMAEVFRIGLELKRDQELTV